MHFGRCSRLLLNQYKAFFFSLKRPALCCIAGAITPKQHRASFQVWRIKLALRCGILTIQKSKHCFFFVSPRESVRLWRDFHLASNSYAPHASHARTVLHLHWVTQWESRGRRTPPTQVLFKIGLRGLPQDAALGLFLQFHCALL